MTHRAATGILLAVVAMSGCGDTSDSSRRDAPLYVAATPAPTTTLASAATVSTSAPTTPATAIDRIDDAAVASVPAERLDNEIRLMWIGGSHVVLEDRSLPDAVLQRLSAIGGRPLRLIPDTRIAPLPADIRERVELASTLDIDGLIVPLNPSWVTWDGGAACDGITPAHAFYACLLTAPPEPVATQLLADIRALVDAVVATGLPAYMYVIPHSTESLSDPLTATLITDAEAALRTLDPGLDRIEFVGAIFTRDLGGMSESREFFDMVHPTADGVQALADWIAPDLERFFTATLS